MNLVETLAALRAAGAVRAKYDAKAETLEVEFGHLVPLATAGADTGGLVDEKGDPVDLDEGNPWNDGAIEDANRGVEKKAEA